MAHTMMAVAPVANEAHWMLMIENPPADCLMEFSVSSVCCLCIRCIRWNSRSLLALESSEPEHMIRKSIFLLFELFPEV